jgi:hypothetical protein
MSKRSQDEDGDLTRSALSVAEMAEAVGVSRGRFHELARAGVFPPPAYDLRSRRPFYPPELQEICRRIRADGLGFDGRPVLFNRTRRAAAAGRRQRGAGPRPEQRARDRSVSPADDNAEHSGEKADNAVSVLCAQLEYLGVHGTTPKAVGEALRRIYPRGFGGVDRQEVLRTLRSNFARDTRRP